MLHWLHSLLPHVPRYGFVLVFVGVFLNNIGIPLPGETILLGAGFILGKTAGSLWQPMVAGTAACFLGGICSYWFGRRVEQGGLEKVHWLHLTSARLHWPQQYFNRHGAKAVFILRFIAIFPPAAINILAGMAKVPWRIYLLFNLTGSAASTVSYILVGYFFGKKWKQFEAWLGPASIYLILAAITVIVLGGIFRHPLSGFWSRHFSGRK
jgi:membrane protein DedA with SNARE-associated domain